MQTEVLDFLRTVVSDVGLHESEIDHCESSAVLFPLMSEAKGQAYQARSPSFRVQFTVTRHFLSGQLNPLEDCVDEHKD